MIHLPQTLNAWGTPAFKKICEQEISALERSSLPLERGMSHGSQVTDAELGVMVISTGERISSVQVKAGIFFKSVIAGCSCADDPTPVDENAEYCELLFDIDRQSAGARVTVAA